MTSPSVAGVILAGGLSRRMGERDKFRKHLGGEPLLTHVIRRIAPQVDALCINLNGDPNRFEHEGFPVVADTVPNYPGPLAGILAGMEWAASLNPRKNFILTVPGDTPFLPTDLCVRLLTALQPRNSVALPRSKEKVHGIIGLWRLDLAVPLRQAITTGGIRKVTDWVMQCQPAIVDFSVAQRDPFFNINTPTDLYQAEQVLGFNYPVDPES